MAAFLLFLKLYLKYTVFILALVLLHHEHLFVIRANTFFCLTMAKLWAMQIGHNYFYYFPYFAIIKEDDGKTKLYKLHIKSETS